MSPATPGAVPCRVAMAGPRPLPRVMAYALLYLVDLTGCTAGWVAGLNAGRYEPGGDIVYWTGPGAGHAPAGPSRITRPLPVVRGTADRDPLIMLEEEDGIDLPLAGWFHERGCAVRMLLACRDGDEVNGAIGFLDRTGGPGFTPEVADLVRIYGPVAGQTFHAVTETEHRIGSRERAALGTLTSRETEVASLAARGATNAEIAVALGLSTGTVKAHLHRVYEKLGISSRTRLAVEFASVHELAADD